MIKAAIWLVFLVASLVALNVRHYYLMRDGSWHPYRRPGRDTVMRRVTPARTWEERPMTDDEYKDGFEGMP